MRRTRFGWVLLTAGSVWAGGAMAYAANGHVLHGIGARSGALGGAGIALAGDAFTAVGLNPALLTDLEGWEFAVGFDSLHPANAVESEVGPFRGRTEETGDDATIPTVALSRRPTDSRCGVGFGILGRAGFGANYPADPSNPVLAPPPRGIGRVASYLEHLEMPAAIACRATTNLSLGASLQILSSSLSAEPAGFAGPDCDSAGNCYFTSVSKDSALGWGVRLGAVYSPRSWLRLGATFSPEGNVEAFEWNGEVADPSSPAFGAHRPVRLKLTPPETWGAGIAITPGARWAIAVDWRRIRYGKASGFGPGDARSPGLGWRDIDVLAAGLEVRPHPRLALRIGGNRGDNPIPGAASVANVTSPAIIERHWTTGLAFTISASTTLSVAYYRGLENRITGPLSPAVPGATVTNEFALRGFAISLLVRPQ